jgi:hypothetical protein
MHPEFFESLYMIFISPDSARDFTGSGDGRDGHGNGGAFLLANYTRRDFTGVVRCVRSQCKRSAM